MKWIAKYVLVLCLFLGMNTAHAEAKERLLLGTSASGGSFYVLGATYAKFVNDNYPDLDVSVEVGGGPYSNIILLTNKEIEVGLATTWATGEMYVGNNRDNKKHTDIRAFLSLYPSYLQIYSLKGSSIKSLQDIQGKVASSGTAGTSGRMATEAIFEFFDIKPKKLNSVPTGTQVNNMRDKLIDVGLSVSGIPAPYMLELEATHDVNFIPFTKEELKKILVKQPYWNKGIIKKGAYKNVTEDILAVTFWNIAVTHKDISEDIIYKLTKAGFEGQQQLTSAVNDIKNMRPKDILKSTIPLHKGAIKYYREIGLEIPDRLIPAEAK